MGFTLGCGHHSTHVCYYPGKAKESRNSLWPPFRQPLLVDLMLFFIGLVAGGGFYACAPSCDPALLTSRLGQPASVLRRFKGLYHLLSLQPLFFIITIFSFQIVNPLIPKGKGRLISCSSIPPICIRFAFPIDYRPRCDFSYFILKMCNCADFC